MAFGPMGTGKDGEFTFLTDNTLSQTNIPADAQAAGKFLAGLLDRSGGTMTGGLAFASIGDTGTSAGVKWAGSTDGASIYYQTTAKDQGNLVLNLKDDSDCYLRIAKNGAFKSYFSPDDGNFHGNVNGKADTAGTADTGNSVAWANVTGVPTLPSGGITTSGRGLYSTAAIAQPTDVDYIRFDDGTQICCFVGRNDAGKTKGTKTYYLPVPFYDNLYAVDPLPSSQTTNSISYEKERADPGEYILAIGRWK